VTVRVEEPLFPSLVAVIVADPAVTAVTRPDTETELTPGLFEVQVITRPVRTLLFASRVVARSWTVLPTCRLTLAGATDTDATETGAGVTVRVEEPLFPSLVAEIVAVPAATAVTSPVCTTVATPVFELCHVMRRPVSCVPVESRSIADAWAV